jgi:hypothetical protein
MAFPDRRTVNVLCTILLFTVALAIVYVARGVLVICSATPLFSEISGALTWRRPISAF